MKDIVTACLPGMNFKGIDNYLIVLFKMLGITKHLMRWYPIQINETLDNC